MLRVIATLALAASLLAAGTADAATLQPIGQFDQPIYLTSDPGNGNRLFVVERAGKILQVKGGAVSTFADISSMVSCCEPNSERGLLSIALAPDFDSSGRLFVDYTGKSEPGEIHVAELRASNGSAPLSSLRNLLTIEHPNHANHYGGQLQFGPEGNLYISTGDGGGSNDVEQNAQSLSSLLGKILRIDPDPSGALPYTVPPGNPFPLAAEPYDTIWSSGLRNPVRFSFDRQQGSMLIGDVGQGKREEVDYAPPGAAGGANYGWNCFEGSIAGPATDPECAGKKASDFTAPIFEYVHEDLSGDVAHGCAIIGGYVVRDASLGGLYGRYIYGDVCTREIRTFSLANPSASDHSEDLVVDDLNSFGEDACGRLYAISGAGPVYRLAGASAAPCPEPQSGGARSASFIGIRAQSRRVLRNRRILITAFVSPCTGRKGEPVKLLRGGRHIATRRLDRACTAHFRPRISRGAGYRAVIGENTSSLAAFSRRLQIRIRHHHRHHGNR